MLVDEGAPSPESGRVVAERYRLGNLLGEGGMGRVFEATAIETGEVVAVKLLRLERLPSEEERDVAEKRFRREAEAAAAIESPGIPRFHDYGRAADGTSYMVLERLQGATFDELRRAGKLATVERVVELLREVCGILALAHAKGIVHRDLKPSNLYLHRLDRTRSQVKVLDFGIAKFLDHTDDRLTSTGEFLGTLLYMAPEQATDREIGTALDVYSLGVILFEALTGRAPFGGRNPLELVRLHASAPPPSVRSIRPDVSEELEEVIGRCLRKRPEHRYRDATALGAALAGIRSLRAVDEGAPPTAALRTNASAWVGTILEERYELREWVARGRFGSDVYRAVHLRTDASVAVRIWRTGRGPVRDCLAEAFRREARAMEVRHPNVITILDFGSSDDGVYIVTDLVDSVALRDLLLKRGALSYDLAYHLLGGLAEGLGALHARGIVSGGLTPETIRVAGGTAAPERMLLSPFGLRTLREIDLLARELGGDAEGDRFLDYISPEQKAGFEPDARSDVYSLGLIALEMLGGRPAGLLPRTRTERSEGIAKAPANEAEEATAWTIPDGLPDPVASFLLRAADPIPDRRLSSASQFLEAMPKP
jgi:serine/threonine protein kinase